MRGAGRLCVWSAVYSIAHTLLVGCVQGQQDKNCTYLNQGFANQNKDHCFCYKAEWNFMQAWSTIQVQVQSLESIAVSLHLNKLNCAYPEHILNYFTCLLHYLWKPPNSKNIKFHVSRLDQDFCFDVKMSNLAVYKVTFTNIWFNPWLFALFIGGFLLLYYASKLSRTSAAFYVAGTTVGVAASPLFLVFILKKFISQQSTFWLLVITCLFLTAYAMQFFKENINWIWTDKQHYVLGYLLTVGFLSYVTCYRHGPLSSERSITLFTWTLQIIACFMIYFGLALSEIAIAIIAVLVSCKVLYYSYKGLHYVKRLIKPKKPVVKLLTEEEYREQADTETAKALEDLRDSCSRPNFNYWLVVSRLSSPRRFAQFILGSSHVSTEEASAHEEQYGLGSSFLEEQLFMEDQESQRTQQVELVYEENEQAEDYLNGFDSTGSEIVLIH